MFFSILPRPVLELYKRRCVEIPSRRAGSPVTSERSAVYVVEEVVYTYVHCQRPVPHLH